MLHCRTSLIRNLFLTRNDRRTVALWVSLRQLAVERLVRLLTYKGPRGGVKQAGIICRRWRCVQPLPSNLSRRAWRRVLRREASRFRLAVSIRIHLSGTAISHACSLCFTARAQDTPVKSINMWNAATGLCEAVAGDYKQWERDLSSDCCACLLYTSPSPRDRQKSRMPSSA